MPSARRAVYLDNAATSKPSPEVLAALTRALTDEFGNPSSRHLLGLVAAKSLRRARRQVARRLGLQADRIVFTSGGTEALALALLGTARQRRKPGHILVSAVEHVAVHRNAELAQQLGHRVDRIPVTEGGWVDPDAVGSRLRDETFLVAVMHVNNEVGVIQPIQEISAVVRSRTSDCRILVDAVQSFGVLDTAFDRLGADLLAVSAHKLHGPKGVGCLALAPGATVAPLWAGGPQELGLRAGTENVPGIVGLGEAAARGRGEATGLAHVCEQLALGLIDAVPGAYVLGDQDRRAPHIVAVALPERRADVVVNALAHEGVYVSSGSACHSQGSRQSHVLEAMGIPAGHGVVRLSPSYLNTVEEIAWASQAMTRVVAAL